jgi:hypothetical protein
MLPKGTEYLKELAQQIAPKYGLAPSLLLALCYAESNYGLALKPPGPTGSGDFIPRPCSPARDKRMAEAPLPGVVKKTLPNGIPARKIAGPVEAWVPTTNGWGCGLMQFDYEAHYAFCKSGEWKEPAKIMEQACKLLTQNRKQIAAKVVVSGEDLDKAMIASYNAGVGAVVKALQNDVPVEGVTFHRDYVQKILAKTKELSA